MIGKKEREEAKNQEEACKSSQYSRVDRSWDGLIASTKGRQSDDWFLNSGCSHHMCPNKS